MDLADPRRYEYLGPANKQVDDCYSDEEDDIEERVQTYEKEVKNLPASGSAPQWLPSHAERYQAIKSHIPRTEDEIGLEEGDIVFVLSKGTDGWYSGAAEKSNTFGTFPESKVEKI